METREGNNFSCVNPLIGIFRCFTNVFVKIIFYYLVLFLSSSPVQLLGSTLNSYTARAIVSTEVSFASVYSNAKITVCCNVGSQKGMEYNSQPINRGADKSLDLPGRKQSTATEDFGVSYILFIIIIGTILVLFMYTRRLASNETF